MEYCSAPILWGLQDNVSNYGSLLKGFNYGIQS